MRPLGKGALVTALTVVVTLASLGVALIAAGGGHGTYLPFAIFFPYGFLATVVLGGSIGVIAGALTLVQFPLYGIVVGRGWIRDRWRLGAGILLFAHAALALICAVIFLRT